MTAWSKDELHKVAGADDLHIAPFHEDGKHTALRHGYGPSQSMTRSMFAVTTGRSRAGTRLQCSRRPGVFSSPA